MTFWTSGSAVDFVDAQAAGGEATLADVWRTSRESFALVHGFNSRATALERAYDDRIEAVQAATGERLANPMMAVSDGLASGSIIPEESVDAEAVRRQAALDFDRRLSELAVQYPQHRDALGVDRPIEGDAEQLAFDADQNAAQAFGSRDGIGRWLATFGGGVAGSLQDPVQVATLFVGAGPSAARLAGTRILSVAAREALLSGATEAALQPFVQDWRRDVGLDAGWDEAVRDVAFAATLGGAFGAVFGATSEAFAYAGRLKADRATDPLAQSVLAEDPLSAEELASLVETIQDALPDDARGAIGALETEQFVPDLPEGLQGDPGNVQRLAQQAVQEPTLVARLQEQIAADLRQVERGQAPDSLLTFLARRGGIADGGEFGAQGYSNRFIPGAGMLVRRNGLDLDMAREAAAEAGYFDMPADQAVSSTTVADFIDLVREELDGRTVYAFGDHETIVARQQLAELQDMQRRLDEVEADLQGEDLQGLTPNMIDDAARRMLEDGLSADDAVEQAIMSDYYANGDGVPLEDDFGQSISQPEPGDPGPQRSQGDGPGEPDGEWTSPGRVEIAGSQLALPGAPETSPAFRSRLDPAPVDHPEPTAIERDVQRLRDVQRGRESEFQVPGSTLLDDDGNTVQQTVSLEHALGLVEATRDEAALIRACRL